MTTPEIRFDCPDELKFAVVQRSHRNVAGQAQDRWTWTACACSFPQGWGLVRASNTQPVLVMRFEATTPELLDEYRAVVESAVEKAKAAAEK